MNFFLREYNFNSAFAGITSKTLPYSELFTKSCSDGCCRLEVVNVNSFRALKASEEGFSRESVACRPRSDCSTNVHRYCIARRSWIHFGALYNGGNRRWSEWPGLLLPIYRNPLARESNFDTHRFPRLRIEVFYRPSCLILLRVYRFVHVVPLFCQFGTWLSR
jgi:hypothetical protein